MKIQIQRLRNLTTRKLHTEMDHIYEDLETITGQDDIMTHMLPRLCESVLPYLKENITDDRFWDGKHDPQHTGEIVISNPTDEDRRSMVEAYKAMPNPLLGEG